ncbi:hypothetical protein [Oceanisphaera avium]|uniref:Type 4 fimbrial biogenesis protein PilX N-terminal domain-containing protein n=1 Tax=Oceanisphaera avium TaxID=1903694 RepID=A0A1Y0CYU3_9GAMM|nr:hypothetical protein [Oceanisphaera avium]ART80056.1 hypothetical protein CBP12_07780 [Oceanisphaera avium]
MRQLNQGMLALSMSLLLLLILSSVSVFMSRAFVAERRLMLNELEYRVVQAIAEQGVAEAIAQRHLDPSVETLSHQVSHALGDIKYHVNIAPHNSLVGVLQLQASAYMASGTASRISLALAERTVLNPQHLGPKSPLLLGAATSHINGQLQLVLNPGHPISIWSAGALNITGTLHSCALTDYDKQTRRCQGFISQFDTLQHHLASDIKVQDTAFVPDLLHYLFGYRAANLAPLVSYQAQDCSHIQRPGFYHLAGGGHCQLDEITSSREAPVILLLNDMAAIATVPIKFYGLIILVGPAPTLTLAPGSEIIGALVMGKGASSLNGDFTLRYDAGVLCTLGDCQSQIGATPYRLLSILAGSWHDD